MEKVLTKLKHWQIFLLLTAGCTAYFTEIENMDMINISLKLLGFTLFFGWNALLGIELLCCFKNNYDLRKYLFIFNCMIIFICMAFFIFSEEGKMDLKEISLFKLIIGLYMVYAFIDTFIFIARLINEYGKSKKIRIKDYLVYFLGLLLWPIGIWFIQPKLNKMAQNS